VAVLDAVVGRQTDFIVAADGRIMHALAVIYILRAMPGVEQFKIIQPAIDHLQVQIVAGPQWHEGAIRQIVEGLQARLGASLRVDLGMVDAIAPEASGKHRYVVSHVRLDTALSGAVA
jgi:phenylacetate-CoA ligase